jgi:hypothetical protein
MPQDSVHDFRGSKFDDKLFRLDGPTPEKFIKPEAKGLRWHFVPQNRPGKTVGVVWRPPVQGNFTATALYEILEVTQPISGFGIGPELYLILNTPNVEPSAREGISYCRLVRPREGARLVFSHMATNKQGKRITKEFKGVATTAQSERGRLRLAREGAFVVASIGIGEPPEFTEIHRSDIGDTTIRLIRFGAIAGSDPSARLDMRLLEFQMQHARPTPPAQGTGESSSDPANGVRGSLFWVILVLLLFSPCLIVSLFLWWQRKARSSASAR